MPEEPLQPQPVTIFDNVSLSAGVMVATPPIPISDGAVGVRLTIVCDYAAGNKYRLEYVDDHGAVRLVGILGTPVEGDELRCEIRNQAHLAGTSVVVRITAESDSVVTVTGIPVFQ